jgi:hypothetical protein
MLDSRRPLAQGLKGCFEADALRVDVGLSGRLEHGESNQVVGDDMHTNGMASPCAESVQPLSFLKMHPARLRWHSVAFFREEENLTS